MPLPRRAAGFRFIAVKVATVRQELMLGGGIVKLCHRRRNADHIATEEEHEKRNRVFHKVSVYFITASSGSVSAHVR